MKKSDTTLVRIDTLKETVKKNKHLFDKFNNKTVLISGATGLVGSQLALSFLTYNNLFNKTIKVIGLVRNIEKAKNIFGENYSLIDFVTGDVRNALNFSGNLDFIFHTAAITQSKLILQKPVDTLDTMYQGTKNLLDIAKKKQSKFVFISSMEVFGVTNPGKDKIEEKDIGYVDLSNIRNSYAEGKRVCEMLGNSYSHQYGVNVRNIRLAQTFGPCTSINDNRVFAYFAKCALNNEDIVIKSSGESMGNYVDIRDAIVAVLLVSCSDENVNTYTVVNEKSTMTIKQLADMVAERYSNNKINVQIQNNEAEKKVYAPDTTMKLSSKKIRSLGWKPRYSIEDMFDDMIMSWHVSQKDAN